MDNNENYHRRGRKNRRYKKKKSKKVKKTIKIFLSVIFAVIIIFAIAYKLPSIKGLVNVPDNNKNNDIKIAEPTDIDKTDTDSMEINKNTSNNASTITLKPIEKPDMSSKDYLIYKEYNNTSSSYLVYKGKSYTVDYINDFKNDTAWNEGIDGDGMGEWVEIKIKTAENSPQKINGVLIQNGYNKTKDLYYQNNRPKTLKIDVAGHGSFNVEFWDTYNEGFYINLPETYETTGITITILDVFKGSKYNDTCISEAQLVYKR